MRKVIFLVLLVVSIQSFAQNDTTKYLRSNDYGWIYKRLLAGSALGLPGDTTLNKVVNSLASINGKIYVKSQYSWDAIPTGNFKASNDSSFNTGFTTRGRLKQYGDSLAATEKNVSDSLYNDGYTRRDRVKQGLDSLGVSVGNALALKLNISDTSGKWVGLGWLMSLAKYADTSAMLNAYKTGIIALNADTATLAQRFTNQINLSATKVNIGDTSSMLNAYKLKDISHDASISALNADTATLASRFTNQTNLANSKLAITDTLAMLNNRISSIVLNNTGVIHNTPSIATRSGGTWTLTQTLATQSPFTIFARGSGSGTPSFQSIDTNYIPNFSSKVNTVVSKTSFYGTLYNKNSWSSLADFNNATTASVSSNKILLTGGTNTATQTLGYNYYSFLERWNQTAKIRITSAASGTTYGIGLGIRSLGNAYQFSNYVKFDASTGSNGGKLQLYLNGSLVATSSGVLSFSNNDFIVLNLSRNLDVFTASVVNFTTKSSPVTLTFSASVASTSYIIHNTGNFAVYNFGGTFTLDSLGISSSEVVNSNLLLIGDSKTQGYNVASFPYRFATQLSYLYPSVVASGGAGDGCVDVLNRINEIIALKPKQVLMCGIGRNDLATGTSLATVQTNYQSIVTQLQAAGITVYHTNCFYETTYNQGTFSAWITSTYGSAVIDTYSPTASLPGVVAADNTHLTSYGDSVVANTILSAQLIQFGSQINNDIINYAKNNGGSGGGSTFPSGITVSGASTFNTTVNTDVTFDVASGVFNGVGAIRYGGDVGGSSRTANTRKIGLMVSPTYSAAGTGINVHTLTIDNDATNNTVDIGGTPSGANYAATRIRFLAAATQTTTGGTTMATINSKGFGASRVPTTYGFESAKSGFYDSSFFSGVIQASGNVNSTTLLTATSVSSTAPAIDISSGTYNGSGGFRIGANVGAGARSANTRKVGNYVSIPYSSTGTGTDVQTLAIDNDGTNNIISIGGSPSGFNHAATRIQFLTGSTITTTGGTVMGTINTIGLGAGRVPTTYGFESSKSGFYDSSFFSGVIQASGVVNSTNIINASTSSSTSPAIDVISGVFNGSGGLRIGANVGANSRSANTRKIANLVSPNYTNAGTGTDVQILSADNDGTNNIVNIGGTSGGLNNAATRINLLAGATTSTTGGTIIANVTSSGLAINAMTTAGIVTNTSAGLLQSTAKLTTANIDTGRTSIAVVTGGALNKVRDSIVAIMATSNTYTPTLTNTTNITSSTLNQATFTRVGNIVHVNISCSIVPTATSINSTLTFTLPFTTATGTQNYVGNGVILQNTTNTPTQLGLVSVDSTTTARISFYVATLTTSDANIQFDYKIN